MVEPLTKRLTVLAFLLTLPAIGVLSWWAWRGFEDDLMAETYRIHHLEELAAYHVVNNLGLELFHLDFTLRLGVAKALREGVADWPRQVEALVGEYRTEAHYPGLLKDVLLVTESPAGPRRWLTWSSEGWESGSRPSWVPDDEVIFDQPADPLVGEDPVLSLELPNAHGLRQALLLHYDLDRVLHEIVPDLAQKAFDNTRSNLAFDVSVFRQAASPLVSASAADLTVPLFPKAKVSDWLRNYLARSPDSLPGAEEVSVTPQPYLGPGARWALQVNLKPRGLAAFEDDVHGRNLVTALAVFVVFAAGFTLLLISVLGLLRASRRERAFSSLVSHELKTPVAAIRSLSENLSEGLVADPAKVKEYGSQLVTQTQRLGELIGNILALSSLDAARGGLLREEFDAAELMTQAAGQFGLTWGPAEGPWLVRGNRAAVRAALDNLVTNAQRYGAKDGQAAQIELALQKETRQGVHWVGLAVTDHGPGLERSEARHIFEPYRRGRQANRRRVPGGGIGLSLVKTTMKHLNGRVQLHAVPGGGLTVVLWLREGARR